jgi:multiple sugar transport system permease protein
MLKNSRHSPAPSSRAASSSSSGRDTMNCRIRKMPKPLTKPVAITLGLITFVGQWNEYIWTLLIASTNPDLMTLPVGIQLLQSFLDPNRTMPIVMSGIVISVVPVLILFLFLQKYYVRGVVLSGLR